MSFLDYESEEPRTSNKGGKRRYHPRQPPSALYLILFILVFPMVPCAIGGLGGVLFAWTEGTDFRTGFLYVISNLLGFANPLTSYNPVSLAAIIIDVYVSVLGLLTFGIVLNVVHIFEVPLLIENFVGKVVPSPVLVTLISLHVVIPAAIVGVASVSGVMLAMGEGWSYDDGILYVTSNLLGLATPLTNVMPTTMAGDLVDIYISSSALACMAVFVDFVTTLDPAACIRHQLSRVLTDDEDSSSCCSEDDDFLALDLEQDEGNHQVTEYMFKASPTSSSENHHVDRIIENEREKHPVSYMEQLISVLPSLKDEVASEGVVSSSNHPSPNEARHGTRKNNTASKQYTITTGGDSSSLSMDNRSLSSGFPSPSRYRNPNRVSHGDDKPPPHSPHDHSDTGSLYIEDSKTNETNHLVARTFDEMRERAITKQTQKSTTPAKPDEVVLPPQFALLFLDDNKLSDKEPPSSQEETTSNLTIHAAAGDDENPKNTLSKLSDPPHAWSTTTTEDTSTSQRHAAYQTPGHHNSEGFDAYHTQNDNELDSEENCHLAPFVAA